MSDPVRRVAWAILAVAALLVCAWPYASVLDLWPQTTDGALWISRGSFTNPSWAEWICCKPHFVFYRPTVAASYTLNYAMGGFDLRFYRVTDVAIHLAIGASVYLLYRDLLRGPRWAAWVAAGVFLLHPVSEEVVPVLARRGYGLMTLFGALSVLCFVRACRRGHVLSAPAAGAGLLFAAAVFATEVNFVLAPVYPLLAYHLTWERGSSWSRPLRLCTLPLLGVAAAYGLRFAILGGEHGGYTAAFALEKVWVIARSSWSYLLFPTSATGESAFTPLGIAGVAAVALWYAWKAAVQPTTQLGSRESRQLLVLAVWIGGYTALSILFGVWFFRQAYPALVPFSLLVARVLQETATAARARPWHGALALAPQVLLLAGLVYHSPVLRGLHPAPMRARIELDARMRALDRDLARVEDPAQIYLVLPRETLLRPHPLWSANVAWRMSLTRYWISALHPDREWEIRNLALVGDPEGAPGARAVERVVLDGRPALEFATGLKVQFPGARDLLAPQPDLNARRLWLDLLPVPDGWHGYVYFYRDTQGELIEIPAGNEFAPHTERDSGGVDEGLDAAVVPGRRALAVVEAQVTPAGRKQR